MTVVLELNGVEGNVFHSPVDGLCDELAIADRAPLIDLVALVIVNFDPNAFIADHVFAF